MVPNWAVVNDDPRFHAWLGEADELSGADRQQLLAAADNARDYKRVAKIFQAYERDVAKREAGSQRSLEAQSVPSTVADTSIPQSKKLWTTREIEQVYSDMRRGRYSEAEGRQVEADIHAAFMEGRIQ
jgi:hypothetical protein